jgi:hypothetical protein
VVVLVLPWKKQGGSARVTVKQSNTRSLYLRAALTVNPISELNLNQLILDREDEWEIGLVRLLEVGSPVDDHDTQA